MKQFFLLTLLMCLFIPAHAQMDDKFYYPDKQFWKYNGDHVMAPLLYPGTFIEYMNWLIE
ncbi:MAG: hypothetical protein LBV72_03560 [Tannerella sp.]|jgi:hypothetical protein|nr:hypothetical protein [Tannerella sp.]